MYFKQFYLGCLAHASYLIGSKGEAIVVDPQRDVDEYIEEAAKAGLVIKYIIETHLHADFVSGHKELAEKTAAQIVISELAKLAIPHLPVKDGDKLSVGALELTILATPGHTMESICILVNDKEEKAPGKLLTGDTLFIGDVGRPDLVSAFGIDQVTMATHLYESLKKLTALPPETEVYPAHGAGSLCGKNISSANSSTIGEQIKFNMALKPMSQDDFVTLMTTDLPEIPAYFGKAVATNRAGARALDSVPKLTELTVEEVKARLAEGVILLDVRDPGEFGAGHIKGSVNIGLNGQFASFSGILLPEKQLIVVGNKTQAEEALKRQARAGLENVIGYIDAFSGTVKWPEPLATIAQMSVTGLAELKEKQEDLFVLDVRRKGEYESGHVPQAKSLPLSELETRLGELDKSVKMHVICAGGYRSSMACSLLVRHGFENLVNIQGGTMAWRKAGLPVESEKQPACSA